MSFEKCHKRTKLSKRSTFSVFVLLIFLTNESSLLVSCNPVKDVADVRLLEAVLPQLLQQTSGDLSASETLTIPGLDAVRGFIVRNHQWLTPVVAAVPAKLATLMTLRALRQQSVEQQQLQQINGLRNIANGPDNGPEGPGGDQGIDCGEGACCNGAACDDKKNSMMVFVGDGNIQVKNHGDGDEEGTDNKYYTYQEIDEGKHWGNFKKEKMGLFDKLFSLKPRRNEINIVHNSRPKRHKRPKSKSKSNSKSNHKKRVKTEAKHY